MVEDSGSGRHATMKDVALEAGVSIGTVDRVLHERGRVAHETAVRVRRAAESLDFRPNLVASNLKRSEWRTLLVVVPHPDQDGGFWAMVVAGITRAVQELAHHYVRVRFAHYDRFHPDSFIKIAEEIVSSFRSDTAERPAGVILAPTLQTASATLARRIVPAPIVVLDGELPGVQLLCSITQESYEGGLLAGKLLHLMAKTGRFASVVVGRDDYHLLRRRAGFEDYFEGEASIERIETESETQLRHAVAERLDHAPSIDGIFVTNAATHIVVDTIKSTGASVSPIVGYDLLPENVSCLRDGSAAFLLNQQPENQGYQAVYALYRHVVLGERVEAQIRIPVDLVTRETLQFHHAQSVSTKG